MSAVGRPRFDIDPVILRDLIVSNFTYVEIGNLVGCSERTVAERARVNGVRVTDLASELDDITLSGLIMDVKAAHPTWGYVMIEGHLRSRGFRVRRQRIREIVAFLDPVGLEERRRRALHRREYSVPGPNFIWHIDGNHKMIRWCFVIHGAIDGYSRVPTFLKIANNNRSETVGDAFHAATATYGTPKLVRTDGGGENVEVWTSMDQLYGPGHVIIGKSVHNQRIERLWRDVTQLCMEPYRALFYELEAESCLDPENDLDIEILHLVYKDQIQRSLDRFTRAWISHKIRTAGHQSPLQLFLTGSNYGMDIDVEEDDLEPSLHEYDVESIEVQEREQFRLEVDGDTYERVKAGIEQDWIVTPDFDEQIYLKWREIVNGTLASRRLG